MRSFILTLLLGSTTLARSQVLPQIQGPRHPGGKVKIMGGTGAILTLGTRGYRRFGLYGDVLWEREPLSPYAWGEYAVNRNARTLTLGGGAWKDFDNDWSVKGGLGLTFGRFKDSDESSRSATFETGAEKYLDGNTFGGEYRLTSGSIGGSTAFSSNEKVVGDHVRGKAARFQRAEADHYSYNEFSAYARLPAGETFIGLRATLGLPSYSSAVLTETLSWTIPIVQALSTRLSFSLEQGRQNNAYVSAGLDYRFR